MPYKFAAPPLIATLFINDQDDGDGWSESYYLKTSDYNTAIMWMFGREKDGMVAGTPNVPSIWAARKGMLSGSTFVELIRVSATNIKGDTLVARPPVYQKEPPDWNLLLGNSAENMPNNLCILVRQQGDPPKYHTTRPLHGVPGDILSSSIRSGGSVVFGSRTILEGTSFPAVFEKYADALKRWTQIVKLANKNINPDGTNNITAVDVKSCTFDKTCRYRKVGRPFGLLSGRRVIR